MSAKPEKFGNPEVLGSAGRGSPYKAFGVILILLLWVGLCSSDLVSMLILPSPLRVIMAVRDVGPQLLVHILATALRVVAGLLLGIVFGFSLGILMQFSRRAYILLDGIVETARPIPPVAVVPFFILIFGFAEIGKLLLVTLGTGLVITVATVEAVERVPSSIVKWGLVSGLDRRHLFKSVVVPAAVPELRSGVRIALATAVALVVVSEFMGAQYGLGYLINVAKITLTTPTLILSVFILGAMSWFFDLLVRAAFDHWCAWDVRAKGAVK